MQEWLISGSLKWDEILYKWGFLEARRLGIPSLYIIQQMGNVQINGKRVEKFHVFAVNDFLRDIGEMCNKYYFLSGTFQEKSAIPAIDEPKHSASCWWDYKHIKSQLIISTMFEVLENEVSYTCWKSLKKLLTFKVKIS